MLLLLKDYITERFIKDVFSIYFMKTIKDKLSNEIVWKLGVLPAIVYVGLVCSFKLVQLINKKIENTDYIQNLRKEQKEIRDFQNKFLEASKNKTIIYTPISKTGPSVYIDLEGDRKQDGVLLNYVGSTRGIYGIDVKPIKQKNN